MADIVLPRLRMDRNSSKHTGHCKGDEGEARVATERVWHGVTTDCEDLGNPGSDCLCVCVAKGSLDLIDVTMEEGMDGLILVA